MRIVYVAVACLAVVAAAGGIQANVVGTVPTGIDPAAAAPAIPRDVTGGSSGTRRDQALEVLAAGFGNQVGRHRARPSDALFCALFLPSRSNRASREIETGELCADLDFTEVGFCLSFAFMESERELPWPTSPDGEENFRIHFTQTPAIADSIAFNNDQPRVAARP